MKKWIFICVLFLLSGCSSTNTTLRDQSGSMVIHKLSEEDALRIVRLAITSVLPNRTITTFETPYKGYFTTFRFGLDTYSQRIYAIPVEGETSAGKKIKGFYFEVSGEGSSIVQGRMKNTELFNKLQQLLKDSSKGVVVENYIPSE
jgi:uncharacterized lipoprotein